MIGGGGGGGGGGGVVYMEKQYLYTKELAISIPMHTSRFLRKAYRYRRLFPLSPLLKMFRQVTVRNRRKNVTKGINGNLFCTTDI